MAQKRDERFGIEIGPIALCRKMPAEQDTLVSAVERFAEIPDALFLMHKLEQRGRGLRRVPIIAKQRVSFPGASLNKLAQRRPRGLGNVHEDNIASHRGTDLSG